MTPRCTAGQTEEPLVEGRPELTIHDEDREELAEALADLLLAALAREGLAAAPHVERATKVRGQPT